MSDMPMRLKYLTKMKVILCIFLLYITAVSVFGQSVELNGIVGRSVNFTAAVKIEGKLMHSGVRIGDVTSGRFTPPRNGAYSGRVQWDSSTGLFSLSGLRLEDSGVYTVQNTDQNIITFQLNVYINVSKPNVSITRNEYCTIECTAERGTGVTLSWYREGEKKPYVSSRVASAPYLHLPETVERSGTYTCEAKNSVSNEKASITVGNHCTAPSGPSPWTIVLGIFAAVAVPSAVVFFVKYRRIRRKHPGETKPEFPQDAVRTLIQGETKPEFPQDAVRTLIQVQDIYDKVDPRAYGETTPALPPDDAVRSLIEDEDKRALIYDAVRAFMQVKLLLDIMVPPASDEDKRALIYDGTWSTGQRE